MFVHRFALRDNVTLRLLKIYLYMADVAELLIAVKIRLSINSVSSNTVDGEHNFLAQTFNSNTVTNV
jgi:hypothetical protein